MELKPKQNLSVNFSVPSNAGTPSPKRKKVLLVIGIFLLFTAVAVYIFQSGSKEETGTVSQTLNKKLHELSVDQVTPTAFPYQELTVPYLRERTYKSTLGDTEAVSENESYTSYLTSYKSDGLKINGLLTKPNGKMPNGGWPAIVFIHGYIPPAQYQTLSRYVDYVDYLARNGFVVFKIDLRGHGESEGEPGGGYYGSDYVVDTLNAYSALQSADFVDPKMIGLWGHSMAGNIVSRSMAARPDIPASVIWAGAVYSYVDREKYGIQDASYQPSQASTERQRKRRELIAKYGEASAGNPFWKLVAPTNYLQDIKGAIQLHHAVDDQTVNIAYSRDLNALLDKTNVPHDFFEYPSGGHNISGSSFTLAMERTTAFFKKYLTEN